MLKKEDLVGRIIEYHGDTTYFVSSINTNYRGQEEYVLEELGSNEFAFLPIINFWNGYPNIWKLIS
jgi:hypothetical protein